MRDEAGNSRVIAAPTLINAGRSFRNAWRAGTRNPVFMLDEIDKIGADFRGDRPARCSKC